MPTRFSAAFVGFQSVLSASVVDTEHLSEAAAAPIVPRPGRSYGLQQTLAKTWADTNWLFAKPIIQRWPDGLFLAGQDVTSPHARLWRLGVVCVRIVPSESA